MKDLTNYSLLQHNTFGIDARCRRFLEYEDVQEAMEIARILRESKEPYLIIGGGSNLLLTHDFEGIVVHSAIKGFEFDGCRMLCASGEKWDDMVAESLKHGLYGMENLSLIPGDVGASAVQNIGAYGTEVKDILLNVYVVDIATGRCHIFGWEECEFGYRQSRFKQDWRNRYLITAVTYELSRDFRPRIDYGNIRQELQRREIVAPTAEQLRQVIIDIRQEKLPDPAITGNGGSFFMNPVITRRRYEQLAEKYPEMPHYKVDSRHEKIPAGWMIDQCGWKGQSLGRAGVYDRQALVLVNRGGATGQEILDLCQAIQKDVKDKFGVDIHPEVNIV